MGKITDKLIEKHRHINVEGYDWFTHLYEDNKHRLLSRGFTVENTHFSGFWSQGDGACFTGVVHDMAQFMRAEDLAEHFPLTFALAKHDGVSARVGHLGLYYHERSVDYDFYAATFADVHPGDHDALELFFDVWDDVVEQERDGFEEAVKDALRSHMRLLYDALEEEYDYLTSDDAVREALEANDIFDEEEDDLEQVDACPEHANISL
jgi:hypothetical protein